MASEAEIERLYQLFVANGGGSLTFDGTNLTPKLYSEAIAASNLTPLQMAQLEARQQQYNRQAALNSIANEIDANNFTNPYAARGAYGNSLFNTLGSSSAVTSPIHGVTGLNSAFSGFGSADKALIFAGVLSQTGIDLEKFLKILGLMALGNTMYTSLINHTNNQTANIPQTMEDASSLSSMNEQFGEKGDPCSFFNQLMGILAGVYDGTLDFIDGAVGDISSLLNNSGITSLIQSIIAAIAGAGSIVGDVISAIIGVGIKALGGIISLVSPLINAIGDITSAIANEIAALANMAAQLISKALALLIGGAAADPCKKAVLMNTGSPAMKDAVTQLNQPAAGPPHMIGTTADDRANAEETIRAFNNAKENALIDDGVPQSPFTEEANVYVPNDTDSESDSESPHTSIYPGIKTEVLLQELIAGDGVKYPPYDESGISFVEPKKDYWTREILSTQYADLNKEWMPLQKAYIVKASKLISQMETGSKLKTIVDLGQQRLIELITDLQIHVENVMSLRTNVRHHFTYVTKNINVYDKIDDANERKIANAYQTSIKRTMQRQMDMAETAYNNTLSSWNSIDKNLYY